MPLFSHILLGGNSSRTTGVNQVMKNDCTCYEHEIETCQTHLSEVTPVEAVEVIQESTTLQGTRCFAW
jgi:hypothetical protein